MTFAEYNNNSVEVDGICMDISEPHLIVLSIPKTNSSVDTSVQLDLRITNNRAAPLPLNLYKNLIPELLTSDGQALQRQVATEQEESRSQMNIPQQHGWRFNFTSLFSNFFSQLRLRNSVNIDELFLESTQNRYRYLPMIAKLFWRNNQLQLHFKPGHTWFFNALQPGLYWLRFIGSDLTSSELSSDLEKREEIGSKQATTQFVNLRIVEPTGTDKNAVEVDGVIFETLIPEKILNVPPTQQGAYTPVQIGIRITNNTSTPYSFSLFATLIPQLVGANAQVLRGDYLRTIELRPKESNFPLIMPFESVTFFPDARLLYFKGIPFRLSIAAGDGGYWIFDGLNLGNYQIKLMYKNKATVKEIYGLESTSVRLMQGLWTGLVSTPYVKFFLV